MQAVIFSCSTYVRNIANPTLFELAINSPMHVTIVFYTNCNNRKADNYIHMMNMKILQLVHIYIYIYGYIVKYLSTGDDGNNLPSTSYHRKLQIYR